MTSSLPMLWLSLQRSRLKEQARQQAFDLPVFDRSPQRLHVQKRCRKHVEQALG